MGEPQRLATAPAPPGGGSDANTQSPRHRMSQWRRRVSMHDFRASLHDGTTSSGGGDSDTVAAPAGRLWNDEDKVRNLTPSIEVARRYFTITRPHRVREHTQDGNYRLATPDEVLRSLQAKSTQRPDVDERSQINGSAHHPPTPTSTHTSTPELYPILDECPAVMQVPPSACCCGRRLHYASIPQHQGTPPTANGFAARGASIARWVWRRVRSGSLEPLGEVPEWMDTGVWDIFGLGVALYFRECLYLCYFTGLCSLLELPALLHNALAQPEDTPMIVAGTAYGLSGRDLSPWVHSLCDVLVALALLYVVERNRVRQREVRMLVDAKMVTTQDYSIVVLNPPRRATDPDEYRDFFSRYGEVRCVTVALGNGDLLRLLAKRRYLRQHVNYTSLPVAPLKNRHGEANADVQQQQNGRGRAGVRFSVDLEEGVLRDQDCLGACVHRLLPQRAEHQIRGLLRDLDRQVAGAAQHPDAALPCRVYVTFRDARSQQRCLQGSQKGVLRELLNVAESEDEPTFRGRVLAVRRAEEPQDLLWENLSVGMLERAYSFCVSCAVLGLIMVLDCGLVLELKARACYKAVPVILTIFNILLPPICKQLTKYLERHHTQAQRECSVMVKLSVVRCINFGVLIFLVTPYEERMGAAFLRQLRSALLANCFWVPVARTVVQYSIYRLKQKLALATVRTQEELNHFYEGVNYMLGERYSDVIKTIFMGLFFCPLVPDAMLITAVALCINYWVDKVSMLRLWRAPTMLGGPELATVCRYFLYASVVAHLWVARAVYVNWPFADETNAVRCSFFTCAETRGRTSTGLSTSLSGKQAHFAALYSVILRVLVLGGAVIVSTRTVRRLYQRLVYNNDSGRGSHQPRRRAVGAGSQQRHQGEEGPRSVSAGGSKDHHGDHAAPATGENVDLDSLPHVPVHLPVVDDPRLVYPFVVARLLNVPSTKVPPHARVLGDDYDGDDGAMAGKGEEEEEEEGNGGVAAPPPWNNSALSIVRYYPPRAPERC